MVEKDFGGIELLTSDTEVEAAKTVGMDSMVVNRPGNAPLSDADRTRHSVLENGFSEVTARLLK